MKPASSREFFSEGFYGCPRLRSPQSDFKDRQPSSMEGFGNFRGFLYLPDGHHRNCRNP